MLVLLVDRCISACSLEIRQRSTSLCKLIRPRWAPQANWLCIFFNVLKTTIYTFLIYIRTIWEIFVKTGWVVFQCISYKIYTLTYTVCYRLNYKSIFYFYNHWQPFIIYYIIVWAKTKFPCDSFVWATLL